MRESRERLTDILEAIERSTQPLDVRHSNGD